MRPEGNSSVVLGACLLLRPRRDYRARRDQRATDEALDRVTREMKTDRNMIGVIMDALRASATVGEIHRAMRDAHGFKIEW